MMPVRALSDTSLVIGGGCQPDATCRLEPNRNCYEDWWSRQIKFLYRNLPAAFHELYILKLFVLS